MTAPHTTRAHARLSPSAAYRWLACPGSIRMCDGLPDESGPYAREGTAAHMLAEHCLSHGAPAGWLVGHVLDITAPDVWGAPGTEDNDTRWLVTEEMAAGVQIYLDHCRQLEASGAELEIECRLDLTHVLPDGFGTGDCVAYVDGTLHVVDLKYGRGVPVDPVENPQLLTYAVGALKRYHNRLVDKVVLTIVQPRAPHPKGEVRSWEVSPDDVLAFEDTLRQGADAVAREDAALVPGEHCKFCKAAAICPALRAKALEIAQFEFGSLPTVNEMTSDELGAVLAEADLLENWIKRVKEFAHKQALAGDIPVGFKLVEKRATRKWQSEESALAVLRLTYEMDDEDIYEPRELKSPAKIEKLIGKKSVAALASVIRQESSGLSLVPESDPRPAAKPNATEEFA